MTQKSAAYSEETVRMTARLYECRKAARFILGERYAVALEPWRDLISKEMALRRVPAIRAAIGLGGRLKDDGDGAGLMLLLAAAVEMTEHG